MKALVLTAYNTFGYRDVPQPEVGPEDVLVAVRACGICGSDDHGMDGSTGRRVPPLISASAAWFQRCYNRERGLLKAVLTP